MAEKLLESEQNLYGFETFLCPNNHRRRNLQTAEERASGSPDLYCSTSEGPCRACVRSPGKVKTEGAAGHTECWEASAFQHVCLPGLKSTA